ncbi:MAG: pyruvate dehydrogenase complex E1 component subunit beta [Holosporales bacterium]|jgi:pyruvate dehydrogenase E1 component beta subunit|nr:pyruvate dehydrogenase complex E1 component subunit beta [Holosporales bacterium]
MTTTVRAALGYAMAEEMRKDKDVFLMGEEVALYNGAYKVSKGLYEEFGDKRVIDTPITEHAFTGIGVGAAFSGLRPIIEFMTFNFAMQAIDHIVNSAAKTCYMSGSQIFCPIVFRGPNSVPRKVAAQHSQCFASWYAHIPGLKVVSPYTAREAKGLLKSAIIDNNPVVFLEHEMLYGRTFENEDIKNEYIPLDKAIIMKEGNDITITAFSISVDYALQAAEILAKDGINAEVINLVSLRPIDKETIINSVKKTGKIINIEEGWGECGIGAEIVAIVLEDAFDYLDAEPVRIYSKSVPMPYATKLENTALPSISNIVSAVHKLCR